ncbi:MAG: hypothetical protein JSS95_11195 [Acidobacteria bacterium]|nr:hypothetical protein [Acidobacteriota bacterium]
MRANALQTFTLAIAAHSLALASFAQKPDLRAGGPNPSSIPNHQTAKVVLPGYYLAGAQFTVDGSCTLVSYTASDRQIVMMLTGNRPIADGEGYCNLHVKTAAGHADAWMIVDFTGREQELIKKNARAAEREHTRAFLARSGSRWTLHFQDGSTDTYTSKPDSEPGLAAFSDGAGNEVKIAVGNDNTVTILSAQCWRTGTLSSGRVANGRSNGACAPPGPWTATMQ